MCSFGDSLMDGVRKKNRNMNYIHETGYKSFKFYLFICLNSSAEIHSTTAGRLLISKTIRSIWIANDYTETSSCYLFAANDTSSMCSKILLHFLLQFHLRFQHSVKLTNEKSPCEKNWTADGMPKQSLSGRLFHSLVSSRLHSTAQLTVLSIGSHLSAQWLLFDKGHINKLKTQRSSPQRFYQKTQQQNFNEHNNHNLWPKCVTLLLNVNANHEYVIWFYFIFQPKYIPPQREGYSYPKPAIPFELPAVRIVTTTTRKPVPITYLPPTTPAVCIHWIP